MIIAVAYEDGQVFQHFGHASYFKLYSVDDGKITASRIAGTNGSGHGALAARLKDYKADVLICGGIGGGARTALDEAGIRLVPGVTGSADEAVDRFVAGTLGYDPQAQCTCHEEEHSCRGDCGEDKSGCAGNH